MRATSGCTIVAALLLSACTPRGAVPGEAQILCSSNADCPSGWLCEEFWGRCVNRSTPGTPPAVTAHTVTLTLGRILVTLDVDRELAAPPRVELRTGSATALALAVTSQAGTHYEYAGVLAPAIGDGAHELVADLLDVRGHEARGVLLRTVTLDFTPPVLRTASVVEGRLVEGKAALRAGASATVEVLFSEPLPAPPVASAGGHTLTTLATAEGDRWRFRVTAVGDEPQGTAPISIATSDGSGNEALLGLDGLFRFDFSAPALDPLVAPSVSPTLVRLGQTVYTSFALSEPGAFPPRVELVPVGGGGALAMVDDETHVGAAWRYFHTVEATDAPGTYEVRLASYEDDAGNPGPPATLGSVVVDATPPVSARPAPTRPDATYRAGDVVQVRLLLDADVGAAPSGWLDTRPAVPIACAAVAAREFLCDTVRPLDGTERPEGTVAVILNVTDTAGYRSLASTAVALDFTAPRLASARVVGARTRFRAGDVILLEGTFSEPLAGPPEARLVPGAVLAATATPVGNVWRFSTTVTGTDPEGVADLQVTRAADGAGNADPAGAGSALSLVTIDRTAPVLGDPSVAPSTAAPGNHVLARFTLSELVAAGPRVDAIPSGAGASLPFRVAQPGDLVTPWSYELVVPQDAAAGLYTVRASGLVDDAGNPGAERDLGSLWIPAGGGTATYAVSATGPYGPGDLVDVRLQLDLDPGVVPSGRLETTPPVAIGCTAQAPLDYRCTSAAPLTGAEVPEGAVAVVLDFRDGSGLPAVASTFVTLDFTPPAVTTTAVTVTPAAASGGGTIAVTIPIPEDLAAPPQVWAWPVIDLPPVMLQLGAAGDATHPWTYVLQVPVDVPAAAYDLRVEGMVDRAGNQGLPVTIGTVSLSPRPALASVTALKAPAAYRAGEIVAVEVIRSGPGLAPVAELGTPVPLPMTCAPAGTDTWTCATPPLTGGEPEGPFDVRVSVPDPPLADDLHKVSVTLDFTLPVPIGDDLVVSPPPGSPRASATAATGDSTVVVSFFASEPLASAPTVQVRSPEALPFTAVATDPQFVYSATLAPGAHADGDWTVEVALEDLAGNVSTVALAVPLPVDTTAPSPPAVGTAELVVFHRAPAGTVYGKPPSVQAGPGATDPGTLVLALAGADVSSAVEVARADASPLDGSFAVDLGAAFDASELWLAAVDAAGNASARARVRDVAWTVRPGLEGLLRPRMEQRASLRALEDPAATIVTSRPELAAPGDGSALVHGGQARWVTATPVGPATAPGLGIVAHAIHDPASGALIVADWTAGAPLLTWTDGAWTTSGATASSHSIEAAVYDTFREEIVAFACAGEVTDGPTLAWRAGASGWAEVAPVGASPPCLTPAAMAFDSARGVAVWWGASPALGSATWEWDGQSWTQFDPLGLGTFPPFGQPSAMAFDAVRGRVVLFRDDPLEQVWEFDGTQWSPVTPVAQRSSVFTSLRLSAAPYPGGGVAVLDELALSSWDGASFTTVDAALPLSGWTAPLLAPGPRPGTLVAVQGTDGLSPMAQPQVFDGLGWTPLEWRWDLPLADARLVHNPGLQRLQALDANPAGTPLRTWSGGWSAGDPLPLSTVFLGDAAVAAHPSGEVYVYGGLRGDAASPTVSDEVWRWAQGAGWTLGSQVGGDFPGARAGAAMAWNPVTGTFVMYGGSSGDTSFWTFDGLAWFRSTPPVRSARPSPLHPALAVDPANGFAWVFEGPVAWRWDTGTTSWVQVDAPGDRPAYDDRVAGVDAQENLILVVARDLAGQHVLWGFDYLGLTWRRLFTPDWGVAALADVAWNPDDRTLLAVDASGATNLARVSSGVSPAYVLRVPTRGAGLVLDTACPPGSCTVTRVEARWRGTASDDSLTFGLQGGGELLVWNGTGWALLGETFAIADPLDAAVTDAALLRRIFNGAEATLSLAWRPALRGSPTPVPDQLWHSTQVGVDYAELTVHYRLP